MRQIGQFLKGDQSLKSLYQNDAQRINQLPMSGAYCTIPPPKTFPAKFPMLRLDRIYQRGFSVKRAHVLRGRPWSILSDHSPILAELELE
jgi:endonuclease/exonuclease/phosphatase family metal-dependent hydrolase